jgi:ABC-2 type transport system permease protein/lipopolysaccharide transport system permease protein
LVVLFAVLRTAPTAEAVWVPALTVVLLVFTLGVCLMLSALTVYLRDLRHGVGIIVQFGLFATPVAYSLGNIVPPRWQSTYAAINPLGPVIDGYRETVLLGHAPDFHLLGIASLASLAWLVAGYVVFKRLETGFSDVA